jgi:hypothetical protein
MSVPHIAFNDTTHYGQYLRNALVGLEVNLDRLNEIKDTMALMIDGDGSQAAHFTYMTSKFGFTDDATAKAGWDELNSCLFKLNTNTSVSDVNAALLQLFNKLR